MKKSLVLLGIIFLVSAGGAFAATIDFEGLPFTLITTGGDTVPVPGSVVTDTFKPDGVLFGKAGVSTGVAVVQDSLAPSSGFNSAAGLNAAGILPGSLAGGALVGDIFFNFVSPGTTTPAVTDSVSFTIGDAGGDLDVFQIRYYNLANLLIASDDVSGVSRFAVSKALAGINRVEIDFLGDFGYSMDDLTFNTPSAVPLPGTLMLLASGLGLLPGLRRVRRFLS